jgi:hypothetical protein
MFSSLHSPTEILTKMNLINFEPSLNSICLYSVTGEKVKRIGISKPKEALKDIHTLNKVIVKVQKKRESGAATLPPLTVILFKIQLRDLLVSIAYSWTDIS